MLWSAPSVTPPDERPGQSASGEKEVRAILGMILGTPAFPNAQADNHRKEADKDGQIKGR